MNLLSWLDRFGGGLLVLAFTLVVGYVFYWIIVVFPRRVKATFAGLAAKGYHACAPEDPLLTGILAKGAPLFPVDPLEDKPIPAWTVQLAMVKGDRIVANAFRTQMDRLPHYSTRQGTTMLIDTFSMPLDAEFHLVPAKRVHSVQWEKRHGLQAVATGLDSELLARYEVYARPDQPGVLPPALIQALLKVHPVLADRSAFCYQRGASLRFQPQCWGVCTTNPIYRAEDLDRLLEAADAIATALKSVPAHSGGTARA